MKCQIRSYIQYELVKVTGNEGTKIVTILCKKIWETWEWPLDWKRSIYILLREYTRECSNHQTIALILFVVGAFPYASKDLLKIIQQRIQPYLEFELPQEQAGFRKG